MKKFIFGLLCGVLVLTCAPTVSYASDDAPKEKAAELSPVDYSISVSEMTFIDYAFIPVLDSAEYVAYIMKGVEKISPVTSNRCDERIWRNDNYLSKYSIRKTAFKSKRPHLFLPDKE